MFRLSKKTKKEGPACRQAGMTYVELIVVLGIFSVLLSVALFNYKQFQEKVNIKTLANNIALKLVEAFKSSYAGKYNASAPANWKPAYGVYFDINTTTKFISFVDLNSPPGSDTPPNTCSTSANCTQPNYSIGGEVLDVINITKGNTITPVTGLEVNGTGCSVTSLTSLTVLFRRPNSTPNITPAPATGCTTTSYYAVNIISPQGLTAKIKIFPSGRIQIN